MLLYNIILYAQDYDKTPIPIPDIKNGIQKFEYLRPILLEKGFNFVRKDSISEFWRVPVDSDSEYQKETFSQLLLQLYTVIFDLNSFERVIYLRIRKDLLPRYSDIFQALVTTSFPLKKAVPIRRSIGGGPEKEDYQLTYVSNDSKIIVEYDEDPPYAMYLFRLRIYKK